MIPDTDKELEAQLLEEREASQFRFSYDREIAFYDAVSSGNIEILEEMLNDLPSEDKIGRLSDNEVSNRRYHTIVLVAMVSRFCIEAGMDVSVSYALSDIYIRRLDKATTTKEINAISDAIARDYCNRMKNISKQKAVSRHVVLAIDHIRSNIRENLTVESVADSLSLNPSYLSKLFKQETGQTISHYIREQKIQTACNMLRHLDESSLNIANYLGFSSQSHFIQVFRKETGMTPEEYRRNYYHQSWMNGEEHH